MPTLRDQSGLRDAEIAFDELACDQLNCGLVPSSASEFRIAGQQWGIQGFGKGNIRGVVSGQRVAQLPDAWNKQAVFVAFDDQI